MVGSIYDNQSDKNVFLQTLWHVISRQSAYLFGSECKDVDILPVDHPSLPKQQHFVILHRALPDKNDQVKHILQFNGGSC